MEIEDVDTTEWNRALPDAGFEVFHTAEALDVIDSHTPGDLQLFVGYKGDRPVGLFPVLETKRAVGKTTMSPAPSMGVPRLGPLLLPASPKRRSQEKLNQTFTGEVLDRVGVDESRSLLRVICPSSYTDPRAFIWEGFDVETAFTYVLETRDRTPDDLLGSFSKSLRREIRDGKELDIEISVEGAESAETVHQATAERYREQGREYPVEREYVRDLVAALAETDRSRVYVARTPEGEFVTGITVLYSNDAAYFWQGGTRTIHDGVSVNSLLHWRIIEDIVDDPPRESVTQYDLMGANTQRLCQYKSKFGADLVPYYVVESSGASMKLAKRAYQAVAAFR
jgi:hypothetical protein